VSTAIAASFLPAYAVPAYNRAARRPAIVAIDPKDVAWLAQERDLVARVRAGDRQAFGGLYRAFAARLYRVILLPRLGDARAAEDALADTFTTALERLDQYQAREVSIWFWLARIAVNKANDRHRASARGGRALASYHRLLEPLGEVEAEEEIDPVLLSSRIRATLEQLNERYRRAVELRFLEGRSRPECADALAVRVPTFDVLLLRALRAFRRAWDEGGGLTGDDRGGTR
jgi:RNA polymerase sigma factor (sigma-70 family)